MKKPGRPVLFLLLFAGFASLLILALQPLGVFHYRDSLAVLFPKGEIALKQRDLLFFVQAIMLLVVIPVYILTFLFAWKYRAGSTTSRHDPDLVDHKIAEYFWWGIPFVLTVIICAVTWIKTYELDPYRPIQSDKKELTIQVVALQWKWLFIYPEEKIATVNFLQIPKDVPIHFEITADAPMNSFWIPDLGGQIYAMPKMKSELYLIANQEGEFRGCSANISGEGFARMNFVAKAVSEEAYQGWVASVQQAEKGLDHATYDALAEPGSDQPVALYHLQEEGLFHDILMKYMQPEEE